MRCHNASLVVRYSQRGDAIWSRKSRCLSLEYVGFSSSLCVTIGNEYSDSDVGDEAVVVEGVIAVCYDPEVL